MPHIATTCRFSFYPTFCSPIPSPHTWTNQKKKKICLFELWPTRICVVLSSAGGPGSHIALNVLLHISSFQWWREYVALAVCNYVDYCTSSVTLSAFQWQQEKSTWVGVYFVPDPDPDPTFSDGRLRIRIRIRQNKMYHRICSTSIWSYFFIKSINYLIKMNSFFSRMVENRFY